MSSTSRDIAGALNFRSGLLPYANDAAANEASEAELRRTIKFPPENAPGRAINTAMKNGGAGVILEKSPQASHYNTTTKDFPQRGPKLNHDGAKEDNIRHMKMMIEKLRNSRSMEQQKRLKHFQEELKKLEGEAHDQFASAGARRMKFGDVRIEEKGNKFVVKGKEYNSYEDAKRAAQSERAEDQEMALDPPTSEAQRKAMWAAKSGHSTLGIPKSVGEEFAKADPGGKLPAKAKDGGPGSGPQEGGGGSAEIDVAKKKLRKLSMRLKTDVLDFNETKKIREDIEDLNRKIGRLERGGQDSKEEFNKAGTGNKIHEADPDAREKDTDNAINVTEKANPWPSKKADEKAFGAAAHKTMGRWGGRASDKAGARDNAMDSMSFRDAQDLAAEYGAKRFRGDANSSNMQSWIDRIQWLPSAAEKGSPALQQAIAEANRYAG